MQDPVSDTTREDDIPHDRRGTSGGAHRWDRPQLCVTGRPVDTSTEAGWLGTKGGLFGSRVWGTHPYIWVPGWSSPHEGHG